MNPTSSHSGIASVLTFFGLGLVGLVGAVFIGFVGAMVSSDEASAGKPFWAGAMLAAFVGVTLLVAGVARLASLLMARRRS